MIIRYMAAHIRNCTGLRDVVLWSDQEIIDSFAILTSPVVSFQDWMIVAGEPEEDNAPAGKEALLSELDSISDVVKIGA
jgi:hypothetical protein